LLAALQETVNYSHKSSTTDKQCIWKDSPGGSTLQLEMGRGLPCLD